MERLDEVNARLAMVSIKGKDYAPVNQRILAFWELFPDGRIVTEKTSDDGARCDFRCEVYRDADDAIPAATGHAYEVKSGNINSTSYIENCETSAVGRALGLLGIGATTSIASAEEVQGAIAAQGNDDYARARAHANAAINRYAELVNGDAKAIKAALPQRPDWSNTAEFFDKVADEYEAVIRERMEKE